MKISISVLFITTSIFLSACDLKEGAKGPPSTEAKTNLGKAYQSAKHAKSAQEDREAKLDEEAESLEGE